MSRKNPAIIKRDTRANWLKSSYIPEENVIIIMDNDDDTVSLMIGDGKTLVSKLPDFLNKKSLSHAGCASVNDKSVLIL